ncbi:MAG: bifunctional diaminohydroxyphosphoribosylaminopyrimidine deaminase/5-amino-6-(5-phosphoribosylamino)uracil reductase RibD [Prevotellaceae bacterium]|jgi:diaminohydroxyphosphoribosylaminopyrimidine deaminase/5-amino-6-(5-phosphoribosylamino)uracil reductase|nr:bifunctional diaminohydroxyphosphoribosylaminopyrimidine deaminase/5-amino-6-(5-phosphoribosylamino)uracil reductase RibD [Prevotellaceae bacterium]
MNDKKYIFRCLQIASFAQGKTAPNPMVGAVIVCDDKIIGEGYHKFYGDAHAEVNAIKSVKNHELLTKSTIYVNLEPCSHFGKTPPCADLIIKSGIPKVVIGMCDPNPKVNGKGIARLRKAGIEVVVGVEEEACKEFNRRFLTNIEKCRPYIILKWAQTADGFIDKERQNADTEPLKISNGITKMLNHQLRTQEAAILVGTRTAFLDNPKLTVTKWHGKSPVRMFIDRNLTIPTDYNLYDNSVKTVVFCHCGLDPKSIEKHLRAIAGQARNDKNKNIEFIKLNFSENIIPQILNYLYINHLESIIVEGGRQLLQSFLYQNLWDECHIETSPQIIEKGVKAPEFLSSKPCETMFYEENRIEVFKNGK